MTVCVWSVRVPQWQRPSGQDSGWESIKQLEGESDAGSKTELYLPILLLCLLDQESVCYGKTVVPMIQKHSRNC